MHFREIGLNIANGIISFGKLKILVIDEIIFITKSNTPELFNAPIATNNPINVGKTFKTISIPSFAPSKKISKTGFFSYIPYPIIINIIKGKAKFDK